MPATKDPSPAPVTGFGFAAVMRHPEHGRFMAWYRRRIRTAPGRTG
jgi:hypothetical protein